MGFVFDLKSELKVMGKMKRYASDAACLSSGWIFFEAKFLVRVGTSTWPYFHLSNFRVLNDGAHTHQSVFHDRDASSS